MLGNSKHLFYLLLFPDGTILQAAFYDNINKVWILITKGLDLILPILHCLDGFIIQLFGHGKIR